MISNIPNYSPTEEKESFLRDAIEYTAIALNCDGITMRMPKAQAVLS